MAIAVGAAGWADGAPERVGAVVGAVVPVLVLTAVCGDPTGTGVTTCGVRIGPLAWGCGAPATKEKGTGAFAVTPLTVTETVT